MIGGIIGIIIILIILISSWYYMVNNISSSNKSRYKYHIDFKDGFEHGLPIIKLKINNNFRYFLLDSGSNSNVLTKKYYDSELSGLDIIKKGNISNTSESMETFLVRKTIKYKKNVFEDTDFNVLDMPVFNNKFADKTIVGVLGAPFFNKYKWIIDFDELVVWIK